MRDPAHPQPPPDRDRKHPLQAAREARPSPSGAPGLCMSRRELAEAANAYLWKVHQHRENVTEHDIGRYERGEVRWPRHWRRLALRGVLGAGRYIDLGFYPNRHTTDQPALTSLTTPPIATAGSGAADGASQPAGAAPGGSRQTLLGGIVTVAAACGLLGEQDREGRIGASDVDRLLAITALYRSVDYECGGGMLYVEVGRFAKAASALLNQTYSDTLAPRLLAAVAAARQLAGWTAFDSCQHYDAQRHLLAAERLAVAAGDVLLAARVRYCQARQFQHLRHNRDALDTLRLARDRLGSAATAAVGAMLDGALAASLAALGEGDQALALLGRAEDNFSNIDQDREPDWMHFYDRGELLAQHGRVYRDMARTDRRHGRASVRSTSEAIDAFDPQNSRSSVLNEVGLCSALFLDDEPEQAITVGTHVIEQARGMASPRIFDRLRNVRRDLARHETLPEVAEFAHTLDVLGPRTTP